MCRSSATVESNLKIAFDLLSLVQIKRRAVDYRLGGEVGPALPDHGSEISSRMQRSDYTRRANAETIGPRYWVVIGFLSASDRKACLIPGMSARRRSLHFEDVALLQSQAASRGSWDRRQRSIPQ